MRRAAEVIASLASTCATSWNWPIDPDRGLRSQQSCALGNEQPVELRDEQRRSRSPGCPDRGEWRPTRRRALEYGNFTGAQLT
jgi:hypothetical protein